MALRLKEGLLQAGCSRTKKVWCFHSRRQGRGWNPRKRVKSPTWVPAWCEPWGTRHKVEIGGRHTDSRWVSIPWAFSFVLRQPNSLYSQPQKNLEKIYSYYFKLCVHVCGYVHIRMCECRRGCQSPPELESQGGCEPPGVDAVNWTLVFCKSITCAYLPSFQPRGHRNLTVKIIQCFRGSYKESYSLPSHC